VVTDSEWNKNWLEKYKLLINHRWLMSVKILISFPNVFCHQYIRVAITYIHLQYTMTSLERHVMSFTKQKNPFSNSKITNSNVTTIVFFSWQANGHSVWLQVHRDISDNQLQRGRITSGHTDADTIEIGPTTGTRCDQGIIDAQTFQVAVGKLWTNVQKIQGIPNVYQPPGEGAVKQGVGQRFQVEVMWKSTRALITNSEKKKNYHYFLLFGYILYFS